MSYASLLLATKEFLIDNLKYDNRPIDETLCNVMADGRPPAECGELFLSVHPGSFRGVSMEILECVHSLNITITLRTANAAFDKLGLTHVTDFSLGIGELAQTLAEYIHLNQSIINLANTKIDIYKNRWVEPLRFSSASTPRLESGRWFHAESGIEEAIVQTLSFTDAKRVQFGAFQPYPENYDGIQDSQLKDKFNLPENLIKDVLYPYDLP